MLTCEQKVARNTDVFINYLRCVMVVDDVDGFHCKLVGGVQVSLIPQ